MLLIPELGRVRKKREGRADGGLLTCDQGFHQLNVPGIG